MIVVWRGNSAGSPEPRTVTQSHPRAPCKQSPRRRLGNCPTAVLKRSRELALSQVALSQVASPKASDVGGCAFQVFVSVGASIRIDHGDAPSQFIPHVPNRRREVGIIRYDDCLFVVAVETIYQETCSKVHVGALLLGIMDFHKLRQPLDWANKRACFGTRPEGSKVGREIWQSLQGSQIHQLPARLRRIVSGRIE